MLSKSVVSKISQMTQEKHPRWSLPSIKVQVLRAAGPQNLRNLQKHLFLQNTSNDSFRKQRELPWTNKSQNEIKLK